MSKKKKTNHQKSVVTKFKDSLRLFEAPHMVDYKILPNKKKIENKTNFEKHSVQKQDLLTTIPEFKHK